MVAGELNKKKSSPTNNESEATASTSKSSTCSLDYQRALAFEDMKEIENRHLKLTKKMETSFRKDTLKILFLKKERIIYLTSKCKYSLGIT